MPSFQFGKTASSAPDGRLDAPAFHRNHEPIWAALAPWLSAQSGDVLEAGSGTGQHVVAFARQSPALVWWPGDYEEAHVRSIEAWRLHSGLPNIRPARRLDLAAPEWGLNEGDSQRLRGLTAVFCANVIYIAPWAVTEGLLAGAAARLRDGGRLYLYGPFMREGAHTAPSNAAFDASLRAQDLSWGVRDMTEVGALAAQAGLRMLQTVPMPANNFVLVFERADGA